MPPFVNETGTIGIIINKMVENVTGDMTVALFMILIFLIAVSFAFQIPFEYIMMLIVIPLSIPIAAFFGGPILALLVCGVILVAYWFTKMWLAK